MATESEKLYSAAVGRGVELMREMSINAVKELRVVKATSADYQLALDHVEKALGTITKFPSE